MRQNRTEILEAQVDNLRYRNSKLMRENKELKTKLEALYEIQEWLTQLDNVLRLTGRAIAGKRQELTQIKKHH